MRPNQQLQHTASVLNEAFGYGADINQDHHDETNPTQHAAPEDSEVLIDATSNIASDATLSNELSLPRNIHFSDPET